MAGTQIEKEEERVAAIEKEIADSQNPDGGNNDAPAVVDPGTTPVDAAVSVETPAVAVATVEQPAPIIDVANNVETLQQNYSVLQGKYDAEVPRLNKENQLLVDQVTSLRESVAGYAERANVPPQEVVPDAVVAPQEPVEFTPEEIDGWGQDGINFAVKAAESVVAPMRQELSQLKTMIENITGRIEDVATEQVSASNSRVEDVLNTKLPGWEVTLENPAFRSWADNTYVPLTQTTYWQSIGIASGNENAEDIVNVIKAYNAFLGASSPAAADPISQQAPNPSESPVNSLIEPDRAVDGQEVVANTDEEPISSAMVADTYDKARRNEITPEALKAFEMKMIRAQKNGTFSY